VLILELLFASLKDACAAFPDKRKGEGVYSMADIGLSAFSLFFVQSESLLSYQRSLKEWRKTSNCQTLFDMAKIPTDNPIRSMLDPVHPSHLQSLKNNGYHLEHNFGHGKENLAMMFAAINLLAFAFHTICDCLEDSWIKAREAKRARKRLFEHIRTITAYLVFPSWEILMTTLIKSKPPPEIENQMGN
jgi:hypothetical protein